MQGTGLLLVVITLVTAAAAIDCTGRPLGRYCTSLNSFETCSGPVNSTPGQCDNGAICLCGYVPETSSPCGYTDTPLPEGCTFQTTGGVIQNSQSVDLSSNSENLKKLISANSINLDSASVLDKSDKKRSVSATCNGVTTGSASAVGSRKVVSYFTTWAQYRSGNCKFDVASIDGNIFTHINYAFASISPSFEVKVPSDEVSEGGLYDQVLGLKERFPHLKILLSFGGWSFNAEAATQNIFSNMASTSNNRAAFIKNAIAWVRKYGFDGIDIDWEYPAYESQGGKPSDTPNFTLLLQDLRAAIDAEYLSGGKSKLLMTIAAPVGSAPEAGYELDKIHEPLDWINLMTYDIHGGWESTTGFHTVLFDPSGKSIDAGIKRYLAAGVPSEKLVMGMATYGKTWSLSGSSNGVGAAASGVGAKGSCTSEAGFLSYYEIKNMIASGGTEVYDDKAKAAYAYKGNQWVSYDNPESMRAKLDYVKENRLGGAMIWAMDLDSPEGGFNELQCIMAQNMFNIEGPSFENPIQIQSPPPASLNTPSNDPSPSNFSPSESETAPSPANIFHSAPSSSEIEKAPTPIVETSHQNTEQIPTPSVPLREVIAHDCLVSEWSEWQPCNCSLRLRTRVRTITQLPSDDSLACPILKQNKECTCPNDDNNSSFDLEDNAKDDLLPWWAFVCIGAGVLMMIAGAGTTAYLVIKNRNRETTKHQAY